MKNNKGSVLVIVLLTAAILIVSGISLSFISGSFAKRSNRISGSVKALAIAEAGIADTVERMTTNYLGYMDTTFSANLGFGNYVVVTKTDPITANIIIKSTGTVGIESRTTIVELLGDLYSFWNKLFSSGSAIISGGDTIIESAAPNITGNVHANGNVYHSQGNLQINGDVSACGIVQAGVTSGHSQNANAEKIEVPTFLPFDSWKEKAQNGGLYFDSSQTWNGLILEPQNGVVYVDGDIHINNRSSLIGTLVASGSIYIDNQFEQSPFNTNWPSILAGMDIYENNRNNYYGVLFAGNNFVSDNQKHIKGSIIALNNVDIKNQLTLEPLNQAPLYDPNNNNKPNPEIIIGSWVK